jgi:hypothetical protein
MRFAALILLSGLPLSALLPEGVPLRVVAVVRQGPPPYEDEGRLYRLEGVGPISLKLGDKIRLQRIGDSGSPGRLKVVEAHREFALAELEEAGETYPLKGDLAHRIEPPRPLPLLPVEAPGESRPVLVSLAVTRPAREVPVDKVERVELVPAPPPGPAPSAAVVAVSKRQPIFFLKENASLSPGALEKLRVAVLTWGAEGRWLLGYPGIMGAVSPLQQQRLEGLRAELVRLGVGNIEFQLQSPEGPSRYDVVYVIQEPR